MSAPGRTPFDSVDVQPNGDCGSKAAHEGEHLGIHPVQVALLCNSSRLGCSESLVSRNDQLPPLLSPHCYRSTTSHTTTPDTTGTTSCRTLSFIRKNLFLFVPAFNCWSQTRCSFYCLVSATAVTPTDLQIQRSLLLTRRYTIDSLLKCLGWWSRAWTHPAVPLSP